MRRMLIVAAAALVLSAGAAGAGVPGTTEDTCACGGSKLSLGGYPIGGGWWKCAYVINGWYVVVEDHYGGC